MNTFRNLRIMVLFSLFILVSAVTYAVPTQIMRVTFADGTTQRLLVEQISKVTFKADKNDSSANTGVRLINQKNINQILSLSKQQVLHIASDKKGLAEIALYDIRGNRVVRMATFLSAGFNAVPLAEYGLKNGLYIVRMKNSESIVSKPLNLLK